MQEYAIEYAETWLNAPTPLQKRGGMYVVRAGQNRAKPNYHVGPKMIVYHSVHFVLEGTVMLEDGDERHVLRKGDLFCLYPCRPYVYRIVGGDAPLRMAWLALEGEQVPLVIGQVGFREQAPYVRQRINSRVRGTLRQIFHLFAPDGKEEPQQQGLTFVKDELLLQSLLYKLFGQLSPRRNSPSRKPEKDWVRQCLDYFELHYTENVKVEDVAQWVGMHRSYFSTAFAKEVGQPPQRFLRQLRLAKGMRLLKETSLSITEIALSLGYTDLYSFTRAFSAYYGQSPSKFRATLREETDGPQQTT
jgi:AraC-like DNA-binding protein